MENLKHTFLCDLYDDKLEWGAWVGAMWPELRAAGLLVKSYTNIELSEAGRAYVENLRAKKGGA